MVLPAMAAAAGTAATAAAGSSWLSTLAPSLITAGGSLLGGLVGGSKNKSYKRIGAELQLQLDYQRKLNQTALQDRVADATAAGIHPLYALGSTYSAGSVSPVGDGVGAGSPLGSTLSDLGQNIGRAVSARQTPVERQLVDLQLAQARANLDGSLIENQFKASQLRQLNAVGSPPAYSQGPSGGIKMVPKEIVANDGSNEIGTSPSGQFFDFNGKRRLAPSERFKNSTDDSILGTYFDLTHFIPENVKAGFYDSIKPRWDTFEPAYKKYWRAYKEYKRSHTTPIR